MAVELTQRPPDSALAARARRVMERLIILAQRTEEPGRITRPYGTGALRAAMDDVAAWMIEAGLETHRDAIGNLRGRYSRSATANPALLFGSHLDSVRNAGAFDGPLGVLAALDAVEQLIRTNRSLPFPVEVVAFADEEGMRFQTAYLGSRVLAGVCDDSLLELRDDSGATLGDAIAAFGGDPAGIAASALRPGEAQAYVEVHIEQGPVLESRDAPVGVVAGIVGQSRIAVTFTGEAGHAGTVPPHLRRDALAGAGECILATERKARQTPGLVATVGQIAVEPGVSNVIPGKARMTLDVRHQDDAVRMAAIDDLATLVRNVAAARELDVEWRIAQEESSVRCDPALVASLASAVAASGQPVVRLASGAGHDAVIMGKVVPVSMLFVRCLGGLSHHPDESVRVDDVAVALDVLDRFLTAFFGEETA